ncbi:MAG: shikimate dehydrogenase [Proteobacteria bacterium]|nr:shikimate dehydrogenase [Pseudomonadota bacterium]
MAGKTLKAAVIGFPVSHSLSPAIHNHWIKQYELQGFYDARKVPPEHLKESLLRLMEEGYTGFNVTIPHKQSVMALCDELDDTARAIGAVNTLAAGGDGSFRGYNTDACGFIENIRDAAPGFDFAAGAALVIGAGGAARAAVYGLQRAGAKEIRIANRTHGHAEKLARDFGAEAAPCGTGAAGLKDVALLVNTTPLGMKGQPPLGFDASILPPGAVVCDIVYSPLETQLLKDAAGRGLKTIDGLGMLLHQAARAFEIWTGIRPEITVELREKLVKMTA